MTALCNANGAAQTTLNLSHVYDASYSDDLEHAVVVSRPHELIVMFLTPRIRPGRPAVHVQRTCSHCDSKYAMRINMNIWQLKLKVCKSI